MLRNWQVPSPFSGRRGFSLIEVTVALLLVSTIVLAWRLTGAPEDRTRNVGLASRRVAGAAESAVRTAWADAGEAVLYASGAGRGERRGAFLAIAGPAGVDSSAATAADWLPLGRGVRWGAGAAPTGPLGEPTGRGAPPPEVRCSEAYGCDLGGPRTATFFLSDARDPEVVAAVVVSEVGEVVRFRWDPTARRWTAEGWGR